MTTQPAPAAVRAVPILRKGDPVVYTSGAGHEFSAIVRRAHRDGSATIEVRFAIRQDQLVPGYQGDRYRVEPEQLAVRTRSGRSSAQLRFSEGRA